tara:strand:+ start:470 stop:661 length:192 start_codon:yes stop_codon:yes gene_type:complete
MHLEPEFFQVEALHKGIDVAHLVVAFYPIIERDREECGLPAIDSFYESHGSKFAKTTFSPYQN